MAFALTDAAGDHAVIVDGLEKFWVSVNPFSIFKSINTSYNLKIVVDKFNTDQKYLKEIILSIKISSCCNILQIHDLINLEMD